MYDQSSQTPVPPAPPQNDPNIYTSDDSEEYEDEHGILYTIIKIMLIVLLIAMFAGAAYYWQRLKVVSLTNQINSYKNETNSLNKQISTLQNAAKVNKANGSSSSGTKVWSFDNYYTVSYPSAWSVGEYVGQTAGQFPNIYFNPNNSPSGAPAQLISAWLTTAASATVNEFNTAYSAQASAGNKPVKSTINGYNAFTYKVVQSNQNPVATPGTQTDIYYVLEDGAAADTTLTLDFTESRTGTGYGTAYDASSLLANYTTLVGTTKFLTPHN